jgi:hypothetical protein
MNIAAMTLDNVVRRGQSKTCSRIFGGDERVENGGQDLGLDSTAVVADDNFRLVGCHMRFNGYLAVGARGFNGIEQQIQQQLLNHVGINGDENGPLGWCEVQRNLPLLGNILQVVNGTLNQRVKMVWFAAWFPRAAKAQEVADQIIESGGLLANDAEQFLLAAGRLFQLAFD